MRLIWTESTLLGKLDFIKWGLNQPVSHFAVSFFEEKEFIHSSLYGFERLGIAEFYKHRNKVLEIEIDMPVEAQAEIYNYLRSSYEGLPYDWKYFWSLVRAGIGYKIFNRPLKGKKMDENSNTFICHEVLSALPMEWVKDIDFTKTTTPWFLYQEVVSCIDDKGVKVVVSKP